MRERRQEVREGHDRHVGGQAVLGDQRAECRVDCRRILAALRLTRERDTEAAFVQLAQRAPRLVEVAGAASGVVPFAVRIVDADPERHGMRCVPQRLDLGEPLQHRIRAVRQDQTRPSLGRIREDRDDLLDDEGLAAGERELLDAELSGLVDRRTDVVETDPIEATVPGLRTLETERAREIACAPGVEPQLPQRMRIDIPARLAGGREAERIEARVHADILRRLTPIATVAARVSGRKPLGRRAARVAEREPAVPNRAGEPTVTLPTPRRHPYPFRQDAERAATAEPPDQSRLLEQRLIREAAAGLVRRARREEPLVAVRDSAEPEANGNAELDRRLVPRPLALEREREAAAFGPCIERPTERRDAVARHASIGMQKPQHGPGRGARTEIELRTAARPALEIARAVRVAERGEGGGVLAGHDDDIERRRG